MSGPPVSALFSPTPSILTFLFPQGLASPHPHPAAAAPHDDAPPCTPEGTGQSPAHHAMAPASGGARSTSFEAGDAREESVELVREYLLAAEQEQLDEGGGKVRVVEKGCCDDLREEGKGEEECNAGRRLRSRPHPLIRIHPSRLLRRLSPPTLPAQAKKEKRVKKGVVPKSDKRGNFSEFRNKNLRVTPAKEKKVKKEVRI